MNENYPLIKYLMDAYLNQDFDLLCKSETVEGAIDYYISDSSETDLRELQIEIHSFKNKHTGFIDEAFDACFTPEIIINDANDFLSLITTKIDKIQANFRNQ